MIRIALTGPESSGKTTFAELLANKLGCSYVPEYARTYLSNLNRDYQQEDLDDILKGQLKEWNDLSNEPIAIYDTEILVLKIWSEFKYGNCSKLILDELSKQQIDFYLLCAPDIPYEEDELRENPNDRHILFDLYLENLKRMNVNYQIIEGDREKLLNEIAIKIKEKTYS